MKKIKGILVFILMLTMIFTIGNTVFAEDLTAETTANGITVKWKYSLDGDNVINLVCTNKSEISGKVEVPSTIAGKKVTKLGNKAFEECYGMTEVSLPSSLTYIDYRAFYKCTGLKSLTLPDNITSFGEQAFSECTGLKTVVLPKKLTNLAKYTFYGCSGLTTIVIPENVTSLFYDCLANCKGLKSIVIPESVSTIADDALWNVEKNQLTIYGVKGSYAEEWANKKGYTFDIIANYNANGTTEKIGPKVTHIFVTNPESGTYKAPQTVKIAVVFNEAIKGTAPTLKIKFGEGTTRTVKNGVVTNATRSDDKIYIAGIITYASNYVLYSYNIQNDDEGQLQAVSLEGGTITDTNGNAATLSTPATTGNTIVANKTGIVTNNTENQDKTNNNTKTDSTTSSKSGTGNTDATTTSSSTSGKSTSSKTSETSASTSTKADGSTNKTVLPKAGKDIVIYGVIAILVLLGIAGAAKYYKYRDIK